MRMKHSISRGTRNLLVCIVLIALTVACGGTAAPQEPTSPPPPAATDTAVPTNTTAPTNTPEPTSTPLPTDTPTLEPTETPDLPATAAVEATQAAEKASDEIKADLKELGLNPNEGSLAWVSTETVELMVNTYQSEDAQLLDPDLNVQDFVFQTEVKWNSTGGLAGCGFFFRSEEDLERGHHYRFLAIRFSGLPVWWALRIQYNTVQDDMTLKYPFSDAINQGQDATNVYTLVAKGNSFTFYANGDRMGTVFNSKIQEGNIAYLVQQESGETTCSFQNSWVWALPLE